MLKSLRPSPEWILRVSLGVMYLYSGFDIMARPDIWEGFIPDWLYNGLGSDATVSLFLKAQGAIELGIALLFLAWFLGKWGVRLAAMLAAVEMALILVLLGVDSVTFRDIGLLGAALALFQLSTEPKPTPENATS